MTGLAFGVGSEVITSPEVSCAEKLQVPLGARRHPFRTWTEQVGSEAVWAVTRACLQLCVTTGQPASLHLFAGKWTC